MLVEIWSDVVCPWCAVGKARFDRALEAFEHADDVEVRWRSFELDANRRGTLQGDYAEMLARKYRTSRDQAQGMLDRMTQAGAEEGIDFRFDLARPGNTFDAHRLLHLAADRGRQHHAKARFLAGYHSEGVAIAEHEELTPLAVEAGLDRDEVTAVLGSDTYADAVRADEQQAFEYGISGVPFFVLDRRMGVSGAQPTDHLLAALREASAGDAVTHEHEHAPGEACSDGVCAI